MKNLKTLGRSLNKNEQKTILGGNPDYDESELPWYDGFNPCGTLCFVQGGCRIC